MKLLSILSIFMLLTVGSTNLFGGPWDFLKKRGSLGHYLVFQETGECRNCNLQYYNLSPIIKQHESKKIDLSNSDCTGANLSNVNLSRANFYKTIFNNANLANSNLRKINAKWAKFKFTNMRNTNMYKADLFGANFEGANLKGTDLTKAFAVCIDMTNTDLSNSKLDSTLLDIANLHNTNLYNAKVNKETGFHSAKCDSADFRNIDNLDKTDIDIATLKNCKVDLPLKKQVPTPAQTMTAVMLGWFGI